MCRTRGAWHDRRAATLRPAERRAVVDVCAEACVESGKPLMVGVGSNCTRSTIDDVAALEGTPALAAFLIVVPYYTRPTPAGIVDHFRAIAAASRTPIVAYNIPYRTGRGLNADALLELAGTPGIVGVKQAVGALDHDTLELLRRKPRDFQVLAGDGVHRADDPDGRRWRHRRISAGVHRPLCPNDRRRTRRRKRRPCDARTCALACGHRWVRRTEPACWKAALYAAGEIATATLRPPMSEASNEATQRLLDGISGARHLTGTTTP